MSEEQVIFRQATGGTFGNTWQPIYNDREWEEYSNNPDYQVRELIVKPATLPAEQAGDEPNYYALVNKEGRILETCRDKSIAEKTINDLGAKWEIGILPLYTHPVREVGDMRIIKQKLYEVLVGMRNYGKDDNVDYDGLIATIFSLTSVREVVVDERAEFEKAYLAHLKTLPINGIAYLSDPNNLADIFKKRKRNPDEYFDRDIDGAWTGWRLRASIASVGTGG